MNLPRDHPPCLYNLWQKITYEEFLPVLLGHKLGSYTGYDDSVDPSVSTEFATSSYRAVDSMVAPSINFLDDNANTVFPVRSMPQRDCPLRHFAPIFIMLPV